MPSRRIPSYSVSMAMRNNNIFLELLTKQNFQSCYCNIIRSLIALKCILAVRKIKGLQYVSMMLILSLHLATDKAFYAIFKVYYITLMQFYITCKWIDDGETTLIPNFVLSRIESWPPYPCSLAVICVMVKGTAQLLKCWAEEII